MRSLGNANYWHKVTRTEGRCSPIQTVQSVQMTDNVQLKLRQRTTIMLKVCELAESHRPETDKAMTPEDELKVDEIYQLLSRAMDLPPTASWLDD
jgi:aminopeptidase C